MVLRERRMLSSASPLLMAAMQLLVKIFDPRAVVCLFVTDGLSGGRKNEITQKRPTSGSGRIGTASAAVPCTFEFAVHPFHTPQVYFVECPLSSVMLHCHLLCWMKSPRS